MPIEKNQKLSKTQLIKEVQTHLDAAVPKWPLSQAAIEAVIVSLASVCQTNLNDGRTVEIPGVVRLKTIEKAAQPEKQRLNPFTKKMITVAAKSATKKIKLAPVKALKDAIG